MSHHYLRAKKMYLCNDKLIKENQAFGGTGGVSNENQSLGFTPAFRDTDTGEIYRSTNKDGSPAAIHMLDGLPEDVIIARDLQGNIVAVKSSVIPGFLKDDIFYTREQAAECSSE